MHIPTTITLRSGYAMPRLALGVYETPVTLCSTLVHHAIAHGYRHIDTATGYGNEAGVVAGMNSSSVPRSEIFFTTKLPPRLHGYTATLNSIRDIIGKPEHQGLGYIDLYLIHAPFGTSEDRKGQWKAMVEAKNKGWVRSLGVSNYGVHHLEELKSFQQEMSSRGEDPGVLSVNQVELHPWLQRRDIVEWCEKEGVVMEAYSPLIRGKRWGHPATKKLAEKYEKTEAQVLVRWSLEKGWCPLPKSVKTERVEENGGVWDWEMEEGDVKGLGDKDVKEALSGWDPTVEPL